MQVYLPAIRGIIPDDMVKSMRAFLDFCYIARRNVIDEHALLELEDALGRFRFFRTVYEIAGVRPDGVSLPRQHSGFHYPLLIRLFAAINGICTSITESKHIVAVKKPYRKSNKNNALGQILRSNDRMDKLAAARTDFQSRGMLEGSIIDGFLSDDDLVEPEGIHLLVWWVETFVDERYRV